MSKSAMPIRAVALVAALLLPVVAPASLCVDPGWCLLEDAVLMGNNTIIVPHLSGSINRVKTTERNDGSPFVLIQTRSIIAPPQQSPTPYKVKLGIYKEPYYPDTNVGHFLGDDIFAAFTALYLWNLHRVPRHDITVVMPAGYKDVVERLPVIPKLYRILSANPILFIDAHHQVVFDQVLTGWASLCYSCYQQKYLGVPLVDAFLDRTARAFSVRQRTGQDTKQCRVTLIEKDPNRAEHKYVLANADEIEHAITATTSCVVKRVTWSNCSLSKQIHIMQQTDIALTLPGSDMMNCMFMPTKSAIVSASRCNDGTACEGSNEINLWFGSMPYRHVLFYEYGANRQHMTWKGRALVWNAEHAAQAVRNASLALGL